MTENNKRFTIIVEDDGYWIRDESDFKIIATGLKLGVASNLIAYLNELNDENEQLKQELQKIYEIATVNKVRDIVENVYDDLLYETSDESDYARKKVLKCLEDIDNLRDDMND